MRLVIMQPYLFPYLGYYQLLLEADTFVSYDDVAYRKQSWINRNRILINGGASHFTVPVTNASSFRPIRDVCISDRPPDRWRIKLLKTLSSAYYRAPHFDAIFPLVEGILTSATTHIATLGLASIVEVARYLNLRTHCVTSSAAYHNSHLTGQERVLDICRIEGATDYVNPIGGVELYSRQAFRDAGVTLSFLRSDPVEYRQFGAPFVPALSIIDVLMFNSRTEVQGYLRRYQLQ